MAPATEEICGTCVKQMDGDGNVPLGSCDGLVALNHHRGDDMVGLVGLSNASMAWMADKFCPQEMFLDQAWKPLILQWGS